MKPTKHGYLFETLFIKRIVGSLLLALFTLGGISVYFSMTKENYPDLEIPFALIQTEWPGGDPESIEKRITNKIEEKIKAVPNLKVYESASYNSFSMITVEFKVNADVNECINNLRAEIDKIDDLPSDAKKPVITKASVDDTPILTVNLYGDINSQMKNRVAEDLKDYLLKISGIREININGQRKEEIFILLHNQVIQSLNISGKTIKDKILDAHFDMPLEDIECKSFSPSLRVLCRFRDLDDLANLPISRINGRAILLKEVAEIRKDLAQKKSIIRFSYRGKAFKSAISLDIIRSPGADTVKIVEKARNALEKFSMSEQWPAGLNYAISEDTSITIKNELRDVLNNGLQAIALVFIVLICILTWREAIIAGLSIPITFAAMLSLLPIIGYTLNQIVIIGMVMALGMLVDVFILMMEGMHENIFEKGLTFSESASRTIKSYAIPAFSGQLTTIFAFMPLAFIPGIAGKFIRIIPVVVSITLFLSFLIAILVSIPLSWFLLNPVVGKTQKQRLMDRVTKSIENYYVKHIKATILRNRFTCLGVIFLSLALFVFAIWTAQFLDSEMFPKGDSMTLGATIELSPGATLEESDQVARKISEVFRRKKFFESVVCYTGLRSPMALNSNLLVKQGYYLIGFGCRFLPKHERKEHLSYKLLPPFRKEVEKKLQEIAPGSKIQFYITSGGGNNKAPVQVRLVGKNMTSLRNLSQKIQHILSKIPGTRDVEDNLGPYKLSINFRPNREAMNFYNITAKDLGRELRYSTGIDTIAYYPSKTSKEELKIRLGYRWPTRKGKPGGPMTLEELATIIVITSKKKTVLSSLLNSQIISSDLSITHYGGNRTVVVSSETDNRTASEITNDLRGKIKEMKEKGEWPADCECVIGGENEDQAEVYANMPILFLVSLFLVITVLALQFDNFKQPLIIMSALPLALIGVLFGFFYGRLTMGFTAVIGVMSLIGIAVNNSIVMVDTMNVLKKSGFSIKDAAASGGGQRLRPIVMTTVTTVIGLIPLSISSPMWMPMCAAIIFGLMAATVISLFVVPALYFLLTPKNKEK